MKTLAVTFAIVGLLGVLLVGFIPMDHDSHHSSENPCPIASAINALCNPGSLAMAVGHISYLQSVGSIPVPIFSMLLIVCFCLLSYFVLRKMQPPLLRLAFVHADEAKTKRPKEKMRAWLSLFENSPSTE